MKIRVTIDLDKADDSMHEHLSEQSMELGVHGCDEKGIYHMYYHSRNDLVEFEDVQKECQNCLHGFRRDTGPNGKDEECYTCDATGFIQ
jgi:hypothetical protein